jgi:hypothetical protein
MERQTALRHGAVWFQFASSSCWLRIGRHATSNSVNTSSIHGDVLIVSVQAIDVGVGKLKLSWLL